MHVLVDLVLMARLGGMKGLIGGILIACFMYSGWDAAIYVNEETIDKANNPGKAAMASVVMLALVYSIVTSPSKACVARHCRRMPAMCCPRDRPKLPKPWDA